MCRGTIQKTTAHTAENGGNMCNHGLQTVDNGLPRSRPRNGLTLLEVVIATFLVGVMLLATMRAVGGVFRTRLVAAQQLKGETLAQQLVAEILRHPYEDPGDAPTFGREPGERDVRADFDDIDDYRDWSASPPETRDGSAIANCTGWTRDVQIERVSVQEPDSSVSWETGLKRIKVTVTDPHGEHYQLVVLRAVSGGLEQRSPIDTTYSTGVGGELQLSAQNGSRTALTPVLNHAESD